MHPPNFDLWLEHVVFVQNNGTENQNQTKFNGKFNHEHQENKSHQYFDD